MASDLSFVEFILGNVDESMNVEYKYMFGEYALYYQTKVVALICDNQLFIKQTKGGRDYIDDIVEASPYPGAKAAFLIDDKLEDKQWLSELIKISEKELPAPKLKKKKIKKNK